MKNFSQLKHELKALKEHYNSDTLLSETDPLRTLQGYAHQVTTKIGEIFDQAQYNEQSELINKEEIETGLKDFLKGNSSEILNFCSKYSLTMKTDITRFLIECAKFCDSSRPLRILFPQVQSFVIVVNQKSVNLEDEDVEKVLSQYVLDWDEKNLVKMDIDEKESDNLLQVDRSLLDALIQLNQQVTLDLVQVIKLIEEIQALDIPEIPELLKEAIHKCFQEKHIFTLPHDLDDFEIYDKTFVFLMDILQTSNIPQKQEILNEMLNEFIKLIRYNPDLLTVDTYQLLLSQSYISIEYLHSFLLKLLDRKLSFLDFIDLIRAFKACDISNRQELFQECLRIGFQEKLGFCYNVSDFHVVISAMCRADDIDIPKEFIDTFLLAFLNHLHMNKERYVMDMEVEDLIFYASNLSPEKFNTIMRHIGCVTDDICISFLKQPNISRQYKIIFLLNLASSKERFINLTTILRASDIADKKEILNEFIRNNISNLKYCHDADELEIRNRIVLESDLPKEEKKELAYDLTHRYLQEQFQNWDQRPEIPRISKIMLKNDIFDDKANALFSTYLRRCVDEAASSSVWVLKKFIEEIQSTAFSDKEKKEFRREIMSKFAAREIQSSYDIRDVKYAIEEYKKPNILSDEEKKEFLYELIGKAIQKEGLEFAEFLSRDDGINADLSEFLEIIGDSSNPNKGEVLYEFIRILPQQSKRFFNNILSNLSTVEAGTRVIGEADIPEEKKKELFYEFIKRGFQLDIFQQEWQLIELSELIQRLDVGHQKELIGNLCGVLVRRNMITNLMSTTVTNLLEQLPKNERQFYLHHKDNVMFIERLIEKGKYQQALDLINCFVKTNYIIDTLFCKQRGEKSDPLIISFSAKTCELMDQMMSNEAIRLELNIGFDMAKKLINSSTKIGLFKPIEEKNENKLCESP